MLCVSCNSENNSENGTKDSNKSEQSSEKHSKVSTGPFEIASGIIHYENKNMKDEIVSKHTLYFDKYGKRIRLDETIAGETSNFLYNEEVKKGVTLWHGRDKSAKIYMRQGEINLYVAQRSTSGFTQGANEEILGRPCETHTNNAKTENGEPKVAYWMHKGITLKEINRLGAGYKFEAVKFEEKPIEDEIFALLKGVE